MLNKEQLSKQQEVCGKLVQLLIKHTQGLTGVEIEARKIYGEAHVLSQSADDVVQHLSGDRNGIHDLIADVLVDIDRLQRAIDEFAEEDDDESDDNDEFEESDPED